ncbi:EF-hand domain-containing family member C2 [Histomonas meleagridis]|uniref:EF-hand domain-containing family member C2 n=1 Tax=Histomonas meleagridis TaxID=135588 RepID=UPI00355A9F51|nr:EF-hand domain-containing family member C2 [Histomonas meleagridis]KAH0805227.1 EF-hand domain-containing family member C2 [Histomonas meleagridis]
MEAYVNNVRYNQMSYTIKEPNLPGFTTKNIKNSNLKSQHFKVVAGMMVTRHLDSRSVDNQIEATRKRLEAAQLKSQSFGPTTYEANYTEPVVPESIVLRFYAYFKQSITESQEETFRVRYVKIYFYTEDDTIMIEEHKERNSGMDQGVLLRRMRVERSDGPGFGSYYRINDFSIGVDININSIVYHIYDCDGFTRRFLSSKGIEMPQSEIPPDDLYTCKRKLTERPIRVTFIDTDKTHLRDFLEYDGKVLRFYSVWDDSNSMFGEKRKFIIHFFLVDKTIEIRQVLPPNSGRDKVSQFLSKTHLKNPQTGKDYCASDLYIGQIVNVYGREFLIYDADRFTKQFLDSTYGAHDWTPINVDDTNQYDGTQTNEIPPYNGWGDEEDSLGYCTSLHPTPPRKDNIKLLKHQGEILRFLAKFKNSTVQDNGRIFVIAYYLFDDTLAVFEKPRRNSGFQEGTFIKKGKYKNKYTGKYFSPSDLMVGEVITINCYEFIITDADEYAYSMMEADPDNYPQADLSNIIMGMRMNKENVLKLKQMFGANDKQKNGFVYENVAKDLLMNVMGLHEHECITVMRRYREKNGFNYVALLDVLN